jgi:type IV pilus assembly protein PilW
VIPISHRRPRGVTLVELMIAVAISSIVLASLFGVVQSQQTAYFQGHLQRAAQGSARAALSFVEQRLAIAGYGLDAPLAFDFQYYGNAALSPDQVIPCPPLAPSSCPRDAVDGSDELVFYARNPRYWVPDDRTGAVQPSGNAWRVEAVDTTSVTLTARPGDVFERGRILQLVCKNAEAWAYVTVSARGTAQNPSDPSSLRLTLFGSSSGNPFRRQAYAATVACLTGGSARAFLVDRFRFHVRPVPVPAGYVPYLVLDTGLDVNGDGSVTEADETIVAEGIESFQVGYVMANEALAPRGTTAGAPIAFRSGTAGTSANAITLLGYDATAERAVGAGEYEPTSWYRYAVGPIPAVAPERLTDHQANIRAVRIAIVARGADPDPAQRRTEVLLPILNQSALPSWIPAMQPFNRARVEATLPVRNMVVRAMNDF